MTFNYNASTASARIYGSFKATGNKTEFIIPKSVTSQMTVVTTDSSSAHSANSAINGNMLYICNINIKARATTGAWGSGSLDSYITSAVNKTFTYNGKAQSPLPSNISDFATVTGGTFENNVVGSANEPVFGGLIYVGGNANASITGGTFSGNNMVSGWSSAARGVIGVEGGNVVIGGDVVMSGNTSTQGLNNDPMNGGAIAADGGNLTINGGAIANNSADGTGNGVYVADGNTVTVSGAGLGEVTDVFGIEGNGQIAVEGKIEDTVNVEFVNPATQLGGIYVTSDDNDGQTLKDNFLVTNPGYTFKPVEGAENGRLQLVKSEAIVAVVKHEDDTYSHYTSIQAAIDAAKDGESVLFATYENDADSALTTTGVTLNDTLVVSSGKDISFGSVHVKVTHDGETAAYDYDEEVEVTVTRGQSLTGEMIRVEENASLAISGVTFDGGANWGEAGKPVVSDDGNGTPGTADTGNTGITAHAPIIVNQGSLTLGDGAKLQNNDNNYAAPGEGFGSENYGGGIRNEGAGSLIMNNGSSIEGCYSREGGAIINVNKPNDKNDGGYVAPTDGVGPTVIRTVQIITIAALLSILLRLIMRKGFAKDNRSLTIIRLLENFVRWVIAIVAVLIVLGAWGVDTATLVASAGVLTLIVGLGAQSLVADIVAGIFMVFEGEFQIGDIVIVNGWRGTVQEIGIRTTKLVDSGGNVNIVNNSEITTVVNQTKDMSLAKCVISIEYGESIPRVEVVIRNNLEKIRQSVPAIIDGPYYKGVEALGASSVDLLLVATCKEEDIYQVQRDMNRELKLLFDANGISIPFPQIVLNQPTEFKKSVSKKVVQGAKEFVEEQKEQSKHLEDENE